MRKMLLMVGLLAAAFVHAQNVVHVRANDKPNSVSLKVGQTLEIELDENPSTGYDWVVDQAPDCIAKSGDAAFTPFPNPNHAVGMGGTEVLTFNAVKPGAGHLKLIYARPTETQDVGDTFEMDVVVSGDKPLPVEKTLTLDATQSGQTITMAKGTEFWVSLTISAGIPYQIEMTQKPKGIEKEGEVQVADATMTADQTHPILGGPTKHRFRFKATAVGSGTLSFYMVSVTNPKDRTKMASFKIVVRSSVKHRTTKG